MIRRANVSDVKGIMNLLIQVGNVHANIRPDIFIPNKTKYQDNELIEIIKDDNKPVFVYILNDEVVGHAFCEINDIKSANNIIKRKELYIDDLCVLEKARNQGIGTLLYNYVYEYAKNNDFDYITLNVWTGNDNANKFYKKMGFSERKIQMEKKLK